MSATTRTLALLARGWTTALQSAQKGGCLSLSQRVGEFRRRGFLIDQKWVKTESGARVAAYRLVK